MQNDKTATHSVSLPPLTDVQEMLGNYKALFDTLGCPNAMPFVAQSGFTHPIPEENEKLTNEFFVTMMTIKQLMTSKVNVILIDTRVTGSTVMFVFSFREA